MRTWYSLNIMSYYNIIIPLSIYVPTHRLWLHDTMTCHQRSLTICKYIRWTNICMLFWQLPHQLWSSSLFFVTYILNMYVIKTILGSNKYLLPNEHTYVDDEIAWCYNVRTITQVRIMIRRNYNSMIISCI